MGKYSVLSDTPPTLADLVAMGPRDLRDLCKEAYRRLANQTRSYGIGYRPGNQRFIEFCLKRDIEMIAMALEIINQKEKLIETNRDSKAKDNAPLIFSEEWQDREEPGKRARRQLLLSTEDFLQQTTWRATYSAEPYEGRHMLCVYSKRFDDYDAATTYLLELAKKYAPPNIINHVKRLKRAKEHGWFF
jgi:hypothetical protein